MIKRIALVLAALVLLLAVAAAVFVATFDADRYKPMAVEAMKTRYQRTLRIEGPIELSLVPRLAVKVTKLTLSERARTATFATIDEAALSLEFWPLLRRQVVIDRVSARGVRVSLARDAKGQTNIDDLRAAPAAPAAGAEASSGPALRFDIGRVAIEDARLALRDEMSKTAGTLTLASLTSGRLADGVESPLAIDATLELQRPQALKLAVVGNTALTLDLTRGGASLRGTTLQLSGDTPAVKDLAATFGGSLIWDGQSLQADALALTIKSARLGGLSLANSKLDAKRLAFSPATQKVELDALKLTLAGKQGTNPFELMLDWPRLAVAGDQLKGSGFSGRFKTEGANGMVGRFESGAPTGSFEALRLPAFGLKVDGSAGPRKINGELKSNLLLQPGKGSAALERLELRANLSDASAQPLALTLGGNARADARGAQWNVQGTLNTNGFDSQGSMAFGGAVPNLQASARFDRLDLNQLLAPSAPAPAAAAPADTPVSLDGLKAVNGRFQLAAGQLVFRQYRVADAKLDASLDGGLLRVARLAGGAWGGNVDASGTAEARSARITIKLAASGVDVNALLKDVAGKDLLDGTGRVTADLTTSGTSLGALRSNLAGNAALQLRDGAIKGVNLARSMRQAKAALSMKQDALTKAKSTEKTDFSELTASARITGGVATSDDLDVKSPYLRIGGAGTFDVGRGRVDYTARATVIGAPVGQDGAELAALKGVTVPVLLSGPFEAIDWRVQWSGVAAAAVEAKLKDRLAEKLGAKLVTTTPATAAASAPPAKRPEDKLKDKLRGLFGK